MSKNIYQLEKDRKDKIKDLSIDEIKIYIENLNKKIFDSREANNHEKLNFYIERLTEVFDVTKGKYVNLEWYSVTKKLDITTAKLIECNTKRQSVYVSLVSSILVNAEVSLFELESILNYLLMIYYHNYSFREASLVEDLLIKLEFEYDFKDESFCEYANGLTKKYNETFIREMDYLIGMIKDTIFRIVELTDMHISEFNEKDVLRVLKEIETEKDYVNQKAKEDEGVRIIKEGEYLDLLDHLKESYEVSLETYKSYIGIRDRVLEFINSEDGFADIKEKHYEIASKDFEDGVFDKDSYIAMRPSYDMKNCQFVESTYFDYLNGDDDE